MPRDRQLGAISAHPVPRRAGLHVPRLRSAGCFPEALIVSLCERRLLLSTARHGRLSAKAPESGCAPFSECVASLSASTEQLAQRVEIVDETASEHRGHGAFTMPWLFAASRPNSPRTAVLPCPAQRWAQT